MNLPRLVVFDMDGVLFRGEDPTPGGPEVVQKILENGSRIAYLTNNATKTRGQFAEKLRQMNYVVQYDWIFSSAYGAAMRLRGSSAFVLGEEGLVSELCDAGVKVVTDREAEWVVVGACWHFNYALLDEAQWRIRKGAKFLATNCDAVYPVENGRLRPGAGAIVASVQTASGRPPDEVIGKPETKLLQMALDAFSVEPRQSLVVGDQVDTDIECARRLHVPYVLVLTGVEGQRGGYEGVPTILSIRELGLFLNFENP